MIGLRIACRCALLAQGFRSLGMHSGHVPQTIFTADRLWVHSVFAAAFGFTALYVLIRGTDR